MTLTDWLSALPGIANVRAVTVTIKGQTYPAARYEQTLNTQPVRDANHHGECSITREMIYALGDLPRHYRRRSKAAYTLPGDSREWYIAGYWQGGENLFNPGQDMHKTHPFGPHFLLAPWEVPNGEKIDAYERFAYDRVPLVLS